MELAIGGAIELQNNGIEESILSSERLRFSIWTNELDETDTKIVVE